MMTMFWVKTPLVICYNIYGHWSAFSADNDITQMKEHGDTELRVILSILLTDTLTCRLLGLEID